jgi:hypothetical protein
MDWLDRAGIALHPKCAEEALRALDVVTERLIEAGDARAAFPDVYGIITRRVAESVTLGDRGIFHAPRWISRLAGRFCERYLETLRWSFVRQAQDSGAWAIAYGARDDAGTLPLQHVLLGLSAHINFDLALGIYRTIVEFGAFDAASMRRYKHDHDAVNDLLRASIPEAFDHLIRRHRCEGSSLLFHRAYALSEWAAMWILATWRARVWDDALVLLHARSAEERERVVQAMERRSRRIGRLLALPGAIPVPLHPGARTGATSWRTGSAGAADGPGARAYTGASRTTSALSALG